MKCKNPKTKPTRMEKNAAREYIFWIESNLQEERKEPKKED